MEKTFEHVVDVEKEIQRLERQLSRTYQGIATKIGAIKRIKHKIQKLKNHVADASKKV